MTEMRKELYQKYDSIGLRAIFCTGLGVVVTFMGVIVMGSVLFDYLYLGIEGPTRGIYLVGLGCVLCFGGVIALAWATNKRDQHALKPEILTEAIKTIQNGVPKADISWDDCEKKSFEIVKGLILDGHSGQDVMFMGSRLEYYGLIAAHHEREDEGLAWATENQTALDDINTRLKAKGYAIVKIGDEGEMNA